MEAYLLEWLNLLIRWTHLIVGIAWIGSSFYFVWLDTNLNKPPRDPESDDVAGDLWAVHGGGFYHAQKYQVAPRELPEPLHWFKWEAYTTWLSGMFLLGLIYWLGAEVYLADASGSILQVFQEQLGASGLADDRTILNRQGDQVVAQPPEPLRGILEVRGIGLIRVPTLESIRLRLAVDLDMPPDRLPTPMFSTLSGVDIPLIRLSAFESSAPAKIRLAVGIGPDDIVR